MSTIRCHGCGREEDAHLIDVQDDGTGNFTVMKCVACYGPNWCPVGSDSFRLSVCPDLAPLYEAFRRREADAGRGLRDSPVAVKLAV